MDTGTKAGALACLIAITAMSGCGGDHLSASTACGKAAAELSALDGTLRTVANRTATIDDIAPELRNEAGRLHDLAGRTDGDVAQTIESLSVDVARVRTDALNHRDNTADAAALSDDDARLSRVCPGGSVPR